MNTQTTTDDITDETAQQWAAEAVRSHCVAECVADIVSPVEIKVDGKSRPVYALCARLPHALGVTQKLIETSARMVMNKLAINREMRVARFIRDIGRLLEVDGDRLNALSLTQMRTGGNVFVGGSSDRANVNVVGSVRASDPPTGTYPCIWDKILVMKTGAMRTLRCPPVGPGVVAGGYRVSAVTKNDALVISVACHEVDEILDATAMGIIERPRDVVMREREAAIERENARRLDAANAIEGLDLLEA